MVSVTPIDKPELEVSCPFCGAEPGTHCGHESHPERKHAHAKHKAQTFVEKEIERHQPIVKRKKRA